MQPGSNTEGKVAESDFDFTQRSQHNEPIEPEQNSNGAALKDHSARSHRSHDSELVKGTEPIFGEDEQVDDGKKKKKKAKKEKEKKDKPNVVSPTEIFKYADRTDIILMIIGSIGAACAGVAMPVFCFIFGRMINDLTAGDPETQTAKTAQIMVYVGIAVLVLSALYVACWMAAAARQVARMRLLLFQSVLRQEIGWHDEHKPGELTSRMTGDTRVVQNGINDKLGSGVMNIALGIFGFVFGFISCWELTLVMIGMMPFIAVMGAIIGNIMAKMAEASRKFFAVAGSMSTEVMENIRTVQTFGQEEYEVGRFTASVVTAETAGIKKEFSSSLAAGVTMFIIFVTYTIAFFFSSYLVEWGRTSVGDVVAAFLSVLLGSFGIGFITPSATAFTESRAAAYELFQIIDRVPSIDIDAPGVPMTDFSKSIEFKNVRFAYPTRPDMELFKDLCLTIKKGQKVAFSGASGCGKSSIIGLLQRFYDPLGGEVLVDGQDMRTLSLRDLRNNIGIVSQEPNLFMGSMAENVRVGKPDATLDEVMEACKQANIHDTIMGLPDQYDTPVGAVGSQLSGGQKQRISIARAIIKKPPILLLDEATSALDRHSEVEVQKSLDDLMKGGMTVVIIAHRLATIRNVDCIYYVSHDDVRGSVIEESGTFDELVALQGHFAAMAKTQGAVSSTGAVVATDNQKAIEAQASLYLDDADLEKLDQEKERTERQKVPIEELAKWEVKRAKAGLFRVMMMNKQHMWAVCLGVIGSAITGALGPCNAILFGKVLAVLGRYATDGNLKELRSGTNLWAPLFLAIAAAALIGWMLQFFYGYAGEHLTTKIRTMLFRQILRQDQSFFDIPGRDAGTLAGMLSGDCEAVHQLWGPSIGFKVQTACAIGAGLIIGFCYQWKLACVAMACLPVVAICNFFQQLMMMGMTQKKEGENDDTIVTEALSNVRTVAAFNMQPERVAVFRAVVDEEGPREVRKSIYIGIMYGVSQFVFYAAFALCFWYGGKLIKQGEATFEKVMITAMAVLMGATGAGEAGGFASKMADADKASKRVFSVIDRVPDVDVYERKDTDLGGSGCDIKLHHVRFIYPARPKQVVLQSVDLRFEDGTSNGLMGQTGCGKSTIIQMLARFYDNRGGAVMVNGKNITDLDIETWRKNISIVLQEPNLFSGTVRDNIRYARGDATEEEIIEVAKLAQIHDDIVKMPEGYDTDVGYKGRALSGGQKQRVAIARGLLRRPKLLLLDEATSALDNVTESRVQEGIDDYQRKYNVTTVAIAHRLTTIRNCDQIVLLDTGRILEQGSHDELMALNGEYKARWELYANATQ